MNAAASQRPRRAIAIAVQAVYLALALAVFANAWVSPAARWIGEAKDPRLFIWYLGYLPHALSHGLNPLLTSDLAYPSGTNLMWNSSIVFPAFLLWPVATLVGPVVAYNVLVTVAVATSAWLAYIAARIFVPNRALAFLAGLIYGFSPGMMAQATRHPHVLIAVFPPLALILAREVLVRQRWHPAVVGVVAGVAASIQLLTGEEMLVLTLLVAALGAALLAVMRPAAVRARLPYAGRAIGVAVLCFAVLAAYPLWIQFFGPQRVLGQLQRPDTYVTDLVGFVVPNHTLLQTSLSRTIVQHLTGNPSEDDAYLGLPLLVLFAIGVAASWRRPPIRVISLLTLITALLSLGPHLHIAGWISPVPLPWTMVSNVPLFRNIVPARLMVIAFLGIGIVVAALVGETRAALPGRRRGIAIGLGVGLLFIVPEIPFVMTAAAVPAFFRAGGEVSRVPEGSVALVTPFSDSRSTEAMSWQAVAGYRFKMPEGDVFSAGPYLGPAPTFVESILNRLDDGEPVGLGIGDQQRLLGELSRLDIHTIVVGPSTGRDAIVRLLTSVLGSAPVASGGVDVWWDCCPWPAPSR